MADTEAGVSRRRLLGAGAAAAGAVGVGLTIGASARRGDTLVAGHAVEPFHRYHQAGVATSPQAYASFIALDLRPGVDRLALMSIMKLWTKDAARLTQGVPALADTEPELAAQPSRLTITVGFGPEAFDAAGLASVRPRSVKPLPHFAIDRLGPEWSGGDLLLQICADDHIAIAHASRVLIKNVRSMTTVRWIQRGFRHSPAAAASGTALRNLMGQVDGTVNLGGAAEFDRYVWDDGADQRWFEGGTVLVLRRIRAELDTWDEVDRQTRELTIGRRLDNGAPLTGERETDEPDFAALRNGIPVIPENAHIALARARTDNERFLRRPYNYDDPPPPGETSDSGLIFVTYQRDPDAQFVPVQRRLAGADALNRWTTPIGSAVFAILPGIQPGEYLGQGLLEEPY